MDLLKSVHLMNLPMHVFGSFCSSGFRTAVLSSFFLSQVLFSPVLTRAQDDELTPLKKIPDKDAKNFLTYDFSVSAESHEFDEGNPSLGDWKRVDATAVYSVAGFVELKVGTARPGGASFAWYAASSEYTPATAVLDAYDSRRRRLIGEGLVSAIDEASTTLSGVAATKVSVDPFSLEVDLKARTYTLRFKGPLTLLPDDADNPPKGTQTRRTVATGAPSLQRDEKTEVTTWPMVLDSCLDAAPVLRTADASVMKLSLEGITRPLPADGGGLDDTVVIDVPRRKSDKGSVRATVTLRFRVTQVLPPVELVITAQGYDQWRPNVTADGSPGTPLNFKAELQSPLGKSVPIRADRFEWRLEDVSAEPGFMMNYPLNAQDAKADLRFEPLSGQKAMDGTESKVVVRDKADATFDRAQVVPLDWGGWGELVAVAVLPDGRRITGKFLNTGKTSVLLPKRRPNSHIAEIWLRNHGVPTALDDEDKEEVPEQKERGDGYTLYEEYRGWREGGRHLEGDPANKDFFVLNLIGGDAKPGIQLFESVSGLTVHSKLLRTEMSQKTRLMNGNRREGAHRVDQHGVWIKTFSRKDLGDTGAVTRMTKEAKSADAGRPGKVEGIGILARDNAESAFNKPFNLTATDAMFAYDRAIAHELLHSVGVEHHGKGDYNTIMGYVSPRNPLNKVGRPYYGRSPDHPVELRNEAGHDIATIDYPEYVKFRQIMDACMRENMIAEGKDVLAKRQGSDLLFKTPEQYADMIIELLAIYCFMRQEGVVGVEHGEHSGREDCLMRYYFAKFYEAKGGRGADSLYRISPGTERIGLELCRAAAGTGANDAGHKPQSRFGDAATGYGKCFEAICPNDDIPPSGAK